jgi:hypothetical protein
MKRGTETEKSAAFEARPRIDANQLTAPSTSLVSVDLAQKPAIFSIPTSLRKWPKKEKGAGCSNL